MKPWEMNWQAEANKVKTSEKKPWEQKWEAVKINAQDYDGTIFISEDGEDVKPFEKFNKFFGSLIELSPSEKTSSELLKDFGKNIASFEVNEKEIETKPLMKAMGKAAEKGISSVEWGEVAKSGARSTLQLAKGATSGFLHMIGDFYRKDVDTSNMSPKEKDKIRYSNYQSKVYNKVGDLLDKLWDLGLDSELLKPDEKIFSGSFEENPSLTRGLSAVASGIPSVFSFWGINRVTKMPALATAILSGIDTQDIYFGAREKGASKAGAIGLYTLGTAGTYLLEKKGFESVFENKVSSMAGRIVAGALGEGLTEGGQTLFQNTVKKYGYDDTQKLFQNVVESSIGGFGSGAIATAIFNRNTQIRNSMKENGATDAELDAVQEGMMLEIAKHGNLIEPMFEENIQKSLDSLEEVINSNIDEAEVEKAKKISSDLKNIEDKYYDTLKGKTPEEQAKSTSELLRNMAFFGSKMTGLTPAEFEQQEFPKMDWVKTFEQLKNRNAQFQDIYNKMNEIDIEEAEKGVPEYTQPTININGAERQTTNSDGEPIARSQRSLEYFYRWFGDSKVVDEQGRPLVVYHGSPAKNIEVFDKTKIGLRDYGYFGRGFYFTPNKDMAEFYYTDNYDGADYDNGKVYPVYINLKKPKYVRSIEEGNIDTEKLKKQGYDGVVVYSFNEYSESVRETDEAVKQEIEEAKKYKNKWWQLKNYFDEVIGKKIIDEIVAFNPNQIKSTSNRGTYSESENIYYQEGDVFDNKILMPGKEDFENPTRDYELPRLNKDDLNKLGKEDKPVILKKNIIIKNKNNHPEVSIDEYAKILSDTLLDTTEIIQTQPHKKPNYYTFINENNNEISVVELSENKDNYEVVNFFKVNKKRIEDYRKKAIKDGGEIVITERKTQGAARLSALQDSYGNKILQKSDIVKSKKQLQGEQSPQGAYINRTVYLFEKADVSTIPHEMAHFWREELKSFDNAQAKALLEAADRWETAEFERLYKVIERDNGYAVANKDGSIVYDRQGKGFTTEGEAMDYAKNELFARGFERYLAEGKAPNKSMKQVFHNFLMWLHKKLRDAVSLKLNLSPDIKQVYAEILGGQDIDAFLNTDPDTFIQNRVKLAKDREEYLDGEIEKAIAAKSEKVKDKSGKGFSEIWANAMIPLSTRAKRVSPKLRTRLRRYEFDLANSLNKKYAKITPFMDKWKNMSEEDAIAFDLALKNDYIKKQLEIVDKYGAREEWEQVRKLLEETFDEAINAGLDLGYRPDYFPRKVKDTQGFLDYVRGSEHWSRFEEALRDADPDNQFTIEQQADFINKYLRGFVKVDLMPNKYGSEKTRSIDTIDYELNKFYAPSIEALVSYVEGLNSRIQASKFLGKDSENLEESIGGYLGYLLDNNIIAPKQMDEVRAILQARFGAKGVSNKWLRTGRDMSYIYTMGGINSAITQIDDLSVSMFKAGVWNTLTTAFESKNITKKDLGLESIAAEFIDGSKTSKMVNQVFKATGLDAIDGFAKETLINAEIKKFQKMYKEDKGQLQKLLEPILEDETAQTMEDIKNGVVSDNVLYVLFSELSDVQPISLSELPVFYNRGGNLRVLYMLKSFAIKRIDIFRNECYDKIRSKDWNTRKEGVQNLFKLVATMLVLGASKDKLIDLLYGRDVDLTETVINNLLGLVGISKFQIYQAREKGLTSTVKDIIFPPLYGVVDDAIGDVWNVSQGKREIKDMETLKGIPLVGRFYYWWIGRGKEKGKGKKKKY